MRPVDKGLSLCMIVRDEEANLPDCLRDIRNIADEMIVVDTGSIDRSAAVASSMGARVVDFKWIDDFAAARNASLHYASGSYILWLDADDRFNGESLEKLADLKRELSSERRVAYSFLYNFSGSDGFGGFYYQPRVFPNLSEIRFKGRVHEQVADAIRRKGIPIRKTSISVHHRGWEDCRITEAKIRRNLRLLEIEMAENNRTPEKLYQLAQCYLGLNDPAACLDCIEAAIAETPFSVENLYPLSMYVDCCMRLDRRQDAIRILNDLLKKYPSNGFLHYLMGATLTIVENYRSALVHLEKVSYLGIDVQGGAIPSDIRSRLLYYYGKCLEALNRTDLAEAAYLKALEQAPLGSEVYQSLGQLMIRQGRMKAARYWLEAARNKCQRVHRGIWLILARCCLYLELYPDADTLYQEILEVFPGSLQAMVGRVRVALKTSDRHSYRSCLTRLLESIGGKSTGNPEIFEAIRLLKHQGHIELAGILMRASRQVSVSEI